MKIFFVFNPKAGKEKIKNRLGDIIGLFCYEGHEVTVRATEKAGDAKSFVYELPDGYDRVICAGGDGTLDEVVAGMFLRKNKLPIGYIPAGSTNDFAVSIGIPAFVKTAAAVALSDKLFACDLGMFNDRCFVYVAAFGAFTQVSYETPQNIKNVFGHGAYVLEALMTLSEFKTYKLVIDADEGLHIEDEFIYGMITNSNSVGGIKNITGPRVDLGDGLFEVTLVRKPKNAAEVNAIITDFINRENFTGGVYTFKAGNICFSCEESIPWTLDGEFGGDVKKACITNHRHGFEIAVKQKKTP